ncbi:MAG: ankyrin repeat domain-containing protein [Gemmatimonadota bacterium]|nr:ankyrin repeat domain-containing protein [Gemmatimonadota bacterium]
MDADLLRVRDCILAGDERGVLHAVAANPSLLTVRVASSLVPYDGYFHGATLLHHVAANPSIEVLPPNIVAIADLLLEQGADVDAVTKPGPSQPNDIGWTTLGLVATSAKAREAGVQLRLMDLLIDAGADLDARNGGCLMGALYYRESAAAERLAERGATLDLIAAAGLGDVDRLTAFVDALDAPLAVASRLAHYSLVPWPDEAGQKDLLGMALVYAALHGRVGAIELLLERGAEVDHRPPFDHRATALHWAVMGDQPESVRALLEAGASRDCVDRSFRSTPRGWAEHLGKKKALQAFGGE